MVMFAEPREIERLEDCYFYHTIDLPGFGLVEGDWDLRGKVDRYLGNVDFGRQRVLEIGPASGFLTIEMERRGANVVAVEIPDDPGWDFVPYPAYVLNEIRESRRSIMTRLKNSFWLTHRAFGSKSRLIYGDAYHLPGEIGYFDTAVINAVLLHCHSPLLIVEQCAKRAHKIIITDLMYDELEGKPIMRLHPTPENRDWHTWWDLSSTLITQFLEVMGFRTESISTSEHVHLKRATHKFFTVVAHKTT